MAYNPVRQPCVYVVAEEGTADIAKIGVSEVLARRLGSMQSLNWRKLSIAAAFQMESIDFAQDVEAAVLCALSDHIVRGEWVRVSPEDVGQLIEEHLHAIGAPVVYLIGGNQDNVIKLWSNQQ